MLVDGRGGDPSVLLNLGPDVLYRLLEYCFSLGEELIRILYRVLQDNTSPLDTFGYNCEKRATVKLIQCDTCLAHLFFG